MSDKMKDLIVRISGDVIESNFEDYKTDIIKVIDGVNTDLKTDQDFALAEADTKKLKEAEKAIGEVKTKSLEETASINELFIAMTEISEKIRSTRLNLEKKVRNKKVEIRSKLVREAVSSALSSIKTSGSEPVAISSFNVDHTIFDIAVKGKKTVASMEKSLNECKQGVVKKFENLSELVKTNIEYLGPIKKEYPSSFHDSSSLLTMDTESLKLVVDARVAAAKAAEETRKEKEKSDKKAAETKAAQEKEKEKEPAKENPEQENAENHDITTATAKPRQAAMAGHPGTGYPLPAKKQPDSAPKQESLPFIMTVEMLCQRDKAVDIAQAINEFLKKYGDDITAISLKNMDIVG